MVQQTKKNVTIRVNDFAIRKFIPILAGDAVTMNAPRKLQFSREQYHRMAEKGIWDVKQRVKLIRGELLFMCRRCADENLG